MIKKLLLIVLSGNMYAQNFTLMQNHGIQPVQFSSSIFGDIDNDGDIDLFTLGGAPNVGTSRLYKNDGSGVFELQDSSMFVQKREGGAAFGDVNGDGAIDLVISGSSSGVGTETKLYLNDGTGVFALSPQDFVGTMQGDIVLFDADGDNDNDIVISGMHSGSSFIFALYTNDGTGNFTRNLSSGLETFGMYLSSLATADLNNDGHIDIVASSKTGSSGTSAIRIFTNQGNGTFALASTPQITALLGEVELADFNNDGNIDLLIAGSTPSTNGNPASGFKMELYTNNGAGEFTLVPNLPFVGMGDKLAMAVGDVNNDGYNDILSMGRNYSATIEGNNILTANLYLNNGASGGFTFVSDTPFTGHSNGTIDFADVDGDNDLDVLFTGINNGISAAAKLFRNDGVLSVHENLLSSVVLYPNPTQEFLTITIPNQQILSMTLHSIDGKSARTFSLNKTSTEVVDMSQFVKGIYIITIRTASGATHIQKFIKD